jgi:peptidoglycan/LPS O-acetylase OafA/YrhL
MVYVTHAQPSGLEQARIFLTKRVIRVVPVYWFYTALIVSLLLMVPYAFRDTRFELMNVLKSFLFLPQRSLPVLALGWTLNYEMYFYLLFGVFLLLPRKALLPGLSALFSACSLFGIVYHPRSAALRQITNPILIEFLLGMIIAYLYLGGRTLARGMAWAALLMGIALIGVSLFWKLSEQRLIYWGLPAALIVLGALSLERNAYSFAGILARLGDSSYSLYLSHAFTLNAVGRLLGILGLSGYLYNLFLMCIAYAACAIVAMLSFRVIEQGSSRYLSKKWLGRNSA